MRVEFINPFVVATQNVFQTMLGSTLARGAVSLKHSHAPTFEVSGLIGLGGMLQGMVVVSVGRTTALKAAEILLGSPLDELNDDVMDAVGELTNMIAGAAKTQLARYQLSIGLPTVICGRSHSIKFPSGSPQLIIPFESDLGPVCVEVGLVETPQPHAPRALACDAAAV
jgi:chemotaxis protein CheX